MNIHISSAALLTSLLAALLVAACSSPRIQTGEDAEVIAGGLHRVDHSRAARVYLDPQVDFTRYTAILLDPLDLSEVEIIEPSPGRKPAKWELDEEDERLLLQAFEEAMRKELEERGGYSIVDEAGPQVLRIHVALTMLAPNAPKDDYKSRYVGRGTVYSKGAGAMTMEARLSDSQSGKSIGLIQDRKNMETFWGVNNSVTNMADVQRVFSVWGRQFRDGLDDIHGS